MLGSKLKQAREARGVPLHEVEWATKIKAAYLEALEAEDFASIPGAVYARGFIRTYARYPGLDAEPLIADYNASAAGATEIISTRHPASLAPGGTSTTPATLPAPRPPPPRGPTLSPAPTAMDRH